MKQQAEPERQQWCWICLRRDGTRTPATTWNGYGEGCCSQACGKEFNTEVYADWKKICELAAEIRALSREIG